MPVHALADELRKFREMSDCRSRSMGKREVSKYHFGLKDRMWAILERVFSLVLVIYAIMGSKRRTHATLQVFMLIRLPLWCYGSSSLFLSAAFLEAGRSHE
jgi:hypothetical protein